VTLLDYPKHIIQCEENKQVTCWNCGNLASFGKLKIKNQDDINKKNEELKMENAKLIEENKDFKKKLSETDDIVAENKKITNELLVLKESKADLIKENEKLKENDKSKEASHNKLQIENSNLQNQVKDLLDEKTKLQDSLNSKIKDQNDLINSQDLMRKEIEKLKEEKNTILKDNENITTSLKTEVSELNKKILNYKEQIEELNKKIDEPKKNSKIVNFKPTEHYLIDEIKCNKLIEWIGKDVKFELIYRATDNGFKATDFHKLCDKKGPTLVVVLTNHGKLIGGYFL
jgi:DNA repair exonuclease SbcCD ATPase subunit